MWFIYDLGSRHERKTGSPSLYRKVSRAVGKIVAGCARHGNNLRKGITPGFACFGLNRIEDARMAVQYQIVKTTDDARPLAGTEAVSSASARPWPATPRRECRQAWQSARGQ